MDPQQFQQFQPQVQSNSGMTIIIIVFVILIFSVIGYLVYLSLLPENIDCVLGDWSPCKDGIQNRSILTAESGDGAICGDTKQSCSDCVMSDWTPCDKSGKQTRTITKNATGVNTNCNDLLSQSCAPPVDCVMSDWSICDATGNKTRTVVTPSSGTGKVCGELSEKCANKPILEIGVSTWGGGDFSQRWDRFYKVSCQNGEVESELSDSFGPFGNNYWMHPKVHLSYSDNNGCGTLKKNIYRSKTKDGVYVKLPSEKLMSDFGQGVWDGLTSMFVDNDSSTIY